jgi:hypothetical protein
MIARFSKWRFPDFDPLHALGTDEVSTKILKGGVLYPCQAIFLGHTMPLLPPATATSDFTECLGGKESVPPFVAVERSGVMIHEKMTRAERATLIGLAEVTQRTEESAQLRYLSREELDKVLNEGANWYKDEDAIEEKVNSSAEIHKSDEIRNTVYNRNTCFS